MAALKPARWTMVALAVIAFGSFGHAQDVAATKTSKEDLFWEVRQRQEAAAAAQLILAGNPLTATVLRHESLRWNVWREPAFIGDAVPALSQKWLNEVRDGTPMPNLKGKAPDEIRDDQTAIVKLLSQALVFANNTPLDAFARSAEENKHVTFAHLWEDPHLYRGRVIPIKGRLLRLRKHNAPLEAHEKGVPDVYMGWIAGPTRGSHPFEVLFPILPDGLQVAEEMNREVTFYGYFLKKIMYEGADKKRHETPLLVGPTVILAEPAAAPAATPTSMKMIAAVSMVIIAVAVGLALLGWYYRRGDAAVKKRLARLQGERAVTFGDDETSG
jgi:hypothetical protein